MAISKRKIDMNRFLYTLDGVETPLYSGTLQFWRTPTENWDTRLKDMKDAFCNAFETYVAWNWHEPQEGKFNLHGKTDPRRDLEGFLELIKENGLCVLEARTRCSKL